MIDTPTRSAPPFPVIAVGASAGGLEALSAFLGALPAEPGAAFVIVTHQHPGHVSLLADLLSANTALPVSEAHEGARLEVDHVYVSTPGSTLAIEGGVLRRDEVTTSPRLPIDHFLRSLASDDVGQAGWAVGVILSGTGTDGTIGLRAIKEAGGMVMAQTPSTARFDGMPRSAEGTGLVDLMLPPEELATALVPFLRELRGRGWSGGGAGPSIPLEAFRRILSIIRRRTGHDFSAYKPNTLRRRIERRMNVHQISRPEDFARLLREDPSETDRLFAEMLISVTHFFRDADAYDALSEELMLRLQAEDTQEELRVWVAGCATGEEAFSVAIVLEECMARLGRTLDVTIFATDLDPVNVDFARKGLYPLGIAEDVSPARLEHYFSLDGDHYHVRPSIRENVVFAPQNVLSDPPFTRLDLVVCRNLLIYFEAAEQQRLLSVFHYALRGDGILFLGPSETIGAQQQLFEPIDRKWKLFGRRASAAGAPPPIAREARRRSGRRLAAQVVPPNERAALHTERQLYRLLLDRFAPPSVIVDERGDTRLVQGQTGSFLEPPQGRPSTNIVDMAREGLGPAIFSTLERATRGDGSPEHARVEMRDLGPGLTQVDIRVERVDAPARFKNLFIISFRALAPSPRADVEPSEQAHVEPSASSVSEVSRIESLEEELRYAHESLQSTVEQLESSNEELRSANEELQSTNEEIHSANEELETSREELQSLNEELTTVNTELNAKVEELSHANDDMQNLLNSIQVASVFLDQRLRVKRYTEQARDLIHLLPGDIGRPLADLALYIEHPHLLRDCQRVLDTLERVELEIRDRTGRWLMMRILPYRTSKNVIDGVVATFVPIDRLKRAEAEAQLAQSFFASIVDTVRQPLVVLDGQLQVLSANASFYSMFGEAPSAVIGRTIYSVGRGEWDVPRLRTLLEEVLPEENVLSDFAITRTTAEGKEQRFAVNARGLNNQGSTPESILLSIEETTGKENGPDYV